VKFTGTFMTYLFTEPHACPQKNANVLAKPWLMCVFACAYYIE